ncbi:MAG: hypothetical protein LBL07_00575 [Tannerella sp.]|nr:hypothetical protein [Tannerella sp.]
MMMRCNMVVWFLVAVMGQGTLSLAADKSDKIKPRWLSVLPSPGNDTYYFTKVYTDHGSDLESSRELAVHELIKTVERTELVKVRDSVSLTSEKHSDGYGVRGQSRTVYSLEIVTEGEPVYINYIKVDEYWEDVYKNGRHQFRFHTLYAVAKKGRRAMFDVFGFTNKYGLRGFSRSAILPGWGQIHKGSSAKGICLIAGEALCAGGIIVCENLRADYTAKIRQTHDIHKITDYSDYLNNFETARNVCIGAAAAIYVYNLIDAIAAPGARRIIRVKSTNYTFMPVATPDYAGLQLAIRF